MVCHDRLIEWDAHPRRSAPSIVDDRILTSCAVVCARMDGWWTLAAGKPRSHVSFTKGRNRPCGLDTEARSHGSITWSARSSSDCGMVSLRAFAVVLSSLVQCPYPRSGLLLRRNACGLPGYELHTLAALGPCAMESNLLREALAPHGKV